MPPKKKMSPAPLPPPSLREELGIPPSVTDTEMQDLLRPPLTEMPMPEYTFGSQNIGPTAIRAGSGVVGGILQGVGGPLGSLGSAATTALGEDLAQRAEVYEGIRDQPDLGRVGTAGLMGAIPFPALRTATPLVREAGQAAFNTALPVGMVAAENAIEGRPQSAAELGTAGGLGLLTHGAMRGAGVGIGTLLSRGHVRPQVAIEGFPMETALGSEAGAAVYHGGHTWPPEEGFPIGRPSLEKVRTGTGGMAQGHGFYAAQSEKVGEYYKNLVGEEGSLYKLDLPDEHLDKMLDWDKGLSEQSPFVQEKLAHLDTEINAGQPVARDVSGAQMYHHLENKLGGEEKASQYLLSKGIIGNKYLDAQSRFPNRPEDIAESERVLNDLKGDLARFEANKTDTSFAVIDSIKHRIKLQEEALAKAKNFKPSYNLVLFDPSLATPIARNNEPVPLSTLTGKPTLPPDVKHMGAWPGQGEMYNLILPDGTETTFMVPHGVSFDKQLADTRKNFVGKHEQGGLKDILGNQKGMALIGDSEYKPMRYKEFIAAGHTDSEWDAYAAEQNAKFKEITHNKIIQDWKSGQKFNGLGIVNFLRAKGIDVPDSLMKVLQHEDTMVSATSVEGRGVKRPEAARIHKFVATEMAKLVGQ